MVRKKVFAHHLHVLVGYARVSTEDQNLDLQQEALKRAGCEEIFKGKKSRRAGTK